MQPLVAHCHLSLGRLALRLAQRERARLELTTAITLYRTMEMRFWLSQAEAVRAEGSASSYVIDPVGMTVWQGLPRSSPLNPPYRGVAAPRAC
jgi:hypothetical protein